MSCARLALLAALALAVPLVGVEPGGARPNIVVLMVDTLRADHLGCYGYARPTSPRIDRLAAAGARCARMIAASSCLSNSSCVGSGLASICGVIEERI